MFEDWSRALGAVDVDVLTIGERRSWLGALASFRGAVDAFEARLAVGLDSSAVRGATRCTQREADQAVLRSSLVAELPSVGEALAAGEISSAHADSLARTARRTSVDAVAGSGLLDAARAKPADAMRKQIGEFVRDHLTDADLQARVARQRRDRRGFVLKEEGGMGVLHAEFDDATFAKVKAAVDAETERLYRADGGRNRSDESRTPQQRRADAIAGLLTGTARRRPAPPPAIRNQAILVVHADGSGHVPGIGPLPHSMVERWLCSSDLHGLVLSQDGQPLWLGKKVRLASDAQWLALIVRDEGCVGCGVDPSHCEAHHIRWARHGGPTDIDNLVLVCSHHHHLIHDRGWRVARAADGSYSLEPP